MPDSWTTTALLKRVRGVLANTGMWGIEGVKKYEVKTLFFLITRRLVSFSFLFYFFFFFLFFPCPLFLWQGTQQRASEKRRGTTPTSENRSEEQ
jgi:hypothetical protein